MRIFVFLFSKENNFNRSNYLAKAIILICFCGKFSKLAAIPVYTNGKLIIKYQIKPLRFFPTYIVKNAKTKYQTCVIVIIVALTLTLQC